MSRHPITPEGYEAACKDLRYHKEVLRPSIVLDIEEARAHGDLSENSEYDDAKERQSLCEGRIKFLESVVSGAEIIDILKIPNTGRVVFGTTVVLESPVNQEQRRYRIVGENEADVNAGKISFKSPLGKALIGQEEGVEVTVPAPGGAKVWEILEVLYLGPTE